MIEQTKKTHPKKVCVIDKTKESILIEKLKDEDVEILSGFEGVIEIAKTNVDFMLNAIVGSDGMKPSIIALENNITLGLANKESVQTIARLVYGA